MIKDRIANSVFWLVWSRGAVQLLSFGTTVFVARLLQPADYGLAALATVWLTVLLLICDAGLGSAVIQFKNISAGELNFCFYLTSGIALLSYAALYVAAPLIADWFTSPLLEPVLIVAGLALPIAAISIVPDSLLRKQLEFDKVSKADIGAALAVIPIVFVAAATDFGVWALVAGSVVRPLIRSLIIYGYVTWRPGFAIAHGRLKSILTYSIGSFGSRALWTAYDQSDSIVVGKIGGDAALGFYSMARDLASLPVTKISSVVNQLAVPVMAELQDDKTAMRAALLRGLRLVASVSAPACIGLALVAHDLVKVLLTDKWISIVPIFQILCVAALIKSIDVLLPPILRARYRMKFLSSYNAVMFCVMPLSFFLGAIWLGTIGVALAWITTYPIVMLSMARAAFQEIQLDLPTFVAQVRSPFVASLAMTSTVLGLQAVLDGNQLQMVWVRLITAASGGAFTYILTLWLCGGPLREELREMLGWVFRLTRRASIKK